MPLRKLTILVPDNQEDKTRAVLAEFNLVQVWEKNKPKGQPKEINVITPSDQLQDLTDNLQKSFHKDKHWRLIVSPIETIIPRHEDNKQTDQETSNAQKTFGAGLSREALYDQILKGVQINHDFIILTVLSTIVTIIGLATSNIAVIIGAMVIAPLLGPNLALSFGITLGDRTMIIQAFQTNLLGISATLVLSILVGTLISGEDLLNSQEYGLRTSVGFDGIILALASGAAAVLSLTAGISSTMVGVMVAVALMPPAVTFGLALSHGFLSDAYGAFLLLAINVICVNIAAISIFTFKGIKPRSWYMQNKSKQSRKTSLSILIALLAFLSFLIYLWQG